MSNKMLVSVDKMGLFLDSVINQSLMNDCVRFVKMNKNNCVVATGYNPNILDVLVEVDRFKGKVRFNSEDMPAEKDLPDWLLELIAPKVSDDLARVGWISSNNPRIFRISSPTFGWRYKIKNSNRDSDRVLDAAQMSGGISEQYHKMLKCTPNYMCEFSDLRFFNSSRITLGYLEALGGLAIAGAVKPKYGRVPIVDVLQMPVTLDANGELGKGVYTDCLLTPSKNLIIGLQKEEMELELKFVENGMAWCYFSLNIGFAIEDIHLVVLTENLSS